MLYVGIINRSGEVAEGPTIYEPAWPNIEKYVEGVFWDESERGPIPEPETPEGYTYKRMIKLEGEGAPLIYYTYEPLPEPEETQLQKAQKQIAELESRTKLLEYNTQNMGETLDVHEGAIVDVMTLALGGSPDEL